VTLDHGKWHLDVLPQLDAFDERDDAIDLLDPRSHGRLGYTRVMSPRVFIIDNAVHRFLFKPCWHWKAHHVVMDACAVTGISDDVGRMG